jgi:3-(3-hydroxy-phenyl)propionate hydroxylase
LEAVLTGQAHETLLDTYQPEREPHARALIELAIGMGRVVCTLDREAASARDRNMLAQRAAGGAPLPPLRTAPLGAGCIHAGSSGAGDLFPQPTLGEGVRRLRLDDALGEGPWLITRRPAPVGLGIATYDLDHPALSPFLLDLLRWFSAHAAQAVLVRPDRYVFGTGEPIALAAAWAAAMKPETQPALTPA